MKQYYTYWDWEFGIGETMPSRVGNFREQVEVMFFTKASNVKFVKKTQVSGLPLMDYSEDF